MGKLFAMPGVQTMVEPSAVASSVHGESEESIALWLWWNLLSLDAPTVAVLWASLFAHSSSVRLTIAEYAALALSVWIVYVSDRLLDVRDCSNCAKLTARHSFCFRHATTLMVAIALATATVVYLAARELRVRETEDGLLLVCFVAAYMVTIHTGGRFMTRFLPKELIVGILFAVGTTLPIWCRNGYRSASFSWFVFALLCALNCVAIECWERAPARATLNSAPPFPASFSNLWISGFAAALAVFVFAAAQWYDFTPRPRHALFAVCLSAVSLLFIHHRRSTLSAPALRVLADAALVFPVLCSWIILR